ncbi:MAG: FliM/FliN family flagellar motor switch protein [Candidatus Sulfotelmatobacter sp.]|jgi:flagellar motor switch protein FliN/FliY
MSDAPAPAPEQSRPAAYVQVWAESVAQVLGQITGAAVPCQAQAESAAELAVAGGDDLYLWLLVVSTGGLRGEISLRLPPATVLALAQTFMSEPLAPEAALTPDHREAVVELMRQVAGIVSSAVKARWGEVQLGIELAASAPSWPAAETFRLQAGAEGPARMTLEFGLSAALIAELRAEKAEAAKEKDDNDDKNKIDAAKKPEASASASAGAEVGLGGRPLGLLVDVQLAVSMRFGARRLLLREVLDLSPGAVIELDRRVQEPVDLLLEGKLMARGEVVVIDGNYGLRVTDVSLLDPPGRPHAG